MLLPPGYSGPGFGFPPGYIGAPAADLDADELVMWWLIDIVMPALANAGLGTIQVWTDEIPAQDPGDPTGVDTRFPAVLIKLHRSSDRHAGRAVRVMTWADYLIKVVDSGLAFATNSPTKKIVDDAIEATKAGLTTGGAYYVSKAYRMSAIRYIERSESSGTRYNHQGGIYRLMYYKMP